MLYTRVSLFAFVLLAICTGCNDEGDDTASFDYAIREHFVIPEPGDLGPHAGEVYTRTGVLPDTWTVDFDACSSKGEIVEFDWRIDGAPIETTSGCRDFSQVFDAEGRYEVELTTRDAEGGEDVARRTVEIEEILIVAMGDSYASGEGVPDRPIPEEALDAAYAAEAARDAAEAARDAAIASFVAAQADFLAESQRLDDVLAAQTSYLNALAARDATCPLPAADCVLAQAAVERERVRFAAALLGLGLERFGVGETSGIRGAIASLRAAAQATRDLARDARDAAVAAYQAADDELQEAIDAAIPLWQNARCHRSARSWQALVAQDLSVDPKTAVTFVHLSCSGATVQTGLIGEYGGIVPVGDEMLPPQVERADALVGEREVDLFLVSIGGNDANFSTVIGACVGLTTCYDNPVIDEIGTFWLNSQCQLGGLFFRERCSDLYVPAVYQVYDAGLDASTVFFDGIGEPDECGDPAVELDGCNGLDDLPRNHGKLYDDLVSAFGIEAASRVFLTGYPQLTFDESGEHCGWNVADGLDERLRNLPGVSQAEMDWAGTVVTPALNTNMADTSTILGWTFVDAHVERFAPHGYCSSDSWLVRVPESMPIEASPYGSVHPNALGQGAYADAVMEALAR